MVSNMLARWKFQIWLITVVVAVAALAGTFLDEHVAYAQGEEYDYVDVGLVLEVPEVSSPISRSVNIVVMNHGSRTAYDVEVVVDIAYPENSSFFSATPIVSVGNASLESDGKSLRWTISALQGLQREEVSAQVIHKTSSEPIFDKSEHVHEYFGEVTTLSFESNLHERNNTSRVWSYVTNPTLGSSKQARGSYSVNVSVDAHNPPPGGIVNFTISASSGIITIDQKVAIALTDGLAVDDTGTISYDPATRAPSVSYSNGVFNIGTLTFSQRNDQHSVTLPVRVSSDAVVNEQCLTATITGNPPPGVGPFNDDISDNVVKVCLGDQPVEPLVSGQVDTFTVYPCVGITDAPCDNTDDVRIRAVDKTTTPGRLLNAGDVIANIADAPGRTYDGQMHNNVLQSVNSEDKVSWQTATDSDPDFNGTSIQSK